MNNKIIIPAIVAVVFAAGGFAGGMYYQKSQPQTNSRQFGARGTGRNGFRPVMGNILSSDNKSITVKMADGSSKIVLVSDKTQINKADTATRSELVTGQKVAVFGQENSDGSVTAQSIQLNPMQRGLTPTGTPNTIQ